MSARTRSGGSAELTAIAVMVGTLWATPALAFGPFPASTTVFVDASNTTNVEDGSQAHPFNTIQEGIDAAVSGDVVGVAPGTYDRIELASGISVLGVDPSSTIIRAPATRCCEAVIISHVSPTSYVSHVRLSGFTITGGGVYSFSRVGVWINGADETVRIDHNIISGNDGIGLAVMNAGPSGGPVIENNLIIFNGEGGVTAHFRSGGVIIRNNIIAWNGPSILEPEATAAGSGVFVTHGSSAIVINNTIANNSGNGIQLHDSVPAITNNVISHNGGFGIDVVRGNPRPQVTFNLFFDNGLGNFSDANAPLGTNATLNSASQINSLATNWSNKVADPQFVIPGTDFHLRNGSPAIDAGTDLGAQTSDFDGHPRPQDGDNDCAAITDMGAFEVPYTPPPFLVFCTNLELQRIEVGCETVDCCPLCPGLLDWFIWFDGDPFTGLVLRFENLLPSEAEAIRIEGKAEWLDGSRLRIVGTERIVIHGLPNRVKGGAGVPRACERRNRLPSDRARIRAANAWPDPSVAPDRGRGRRRPDRR